MKDIKALIINALAVIAVVTFMLLIRLIISVEQAPGSGFATGNIVGLVMILLLFVAVFLLYKTINKLKQRGDDDG